MCEIACCTCRCGRRGSKALKASPVCRMVPEQRVRAYQVCKMVPKQVAYTVTRCVPKTVYREVPCCE